MLTDLALRAYLFLLSGCLLVGLSSRGMPRSQQVSSSSTSDSYDSDDFLSSVSGDDADMGPPDGPGPVALAGAGDGAGATDPAAGAMAGPAFAELPPVQLPAAYPDYPAFMERNATMALRELCFFFLADHLMRNHPNRRVSTAKYNAQRRSRGNQDPRLDAAYTALARGWPGPSETCLPAASGANASVQPPTPSGCQQCGPHGRLHGGLYQRPGPVLHPHSAGPFPTVG